MKKFFAICAAALMLAGCAEKGPVLTKSGLNPEDFKAERDGGTTALYTLTNKAGMEVCVTNFGGRIVSVMVPDKKGEYRDVVLGFDTIKDYFPENNQTDFGATIGRYANRIAQGKITVEGVEYQLPQNNYGHCLHGGPNGWQYKVWETVEADGNHLKIKTVSPDGDANFPGTVTAFVTFALTDDNAIDIEYSATTDKPTIVNLTNHSYFNLNGDLASSIHNHVLTVDADRITPADATLITDGSFMDVTGTPFDFRSPKPIGQDINADDEQLKNGNGYDHSFALNHPGDLSKVALRVMSPITGIVMEVFTTEPAAQMYTGNFLDENLKGKFGVGYPARSAVAFETQHYPNTPNCPEYPSCELRPGETYYTRTIYRFSNALCTV